MFRTVLIAIAATAAIGPAVAQPAAPVRSLTVQIGSWAVAPVGDRTVSHCVMGLRSEAADPAPGKPQFMVSADREFAILHARAAEWTFNSSRDVVVTLAASDGEHKPQARVLGADRIDIALSNDPARLTELAAAGDLEIHAEGKAVRLPLGGLSAVLPAYRECLASVGKPLVQRHAAVSTAR
ncbi:MAG: hypothetical protein FJX62_22730 [Alphaproteobacteria bacterium]|nr:hypothetical protein [Alphaproteobacteria bacterium]